ncbi:hypothetical protein GH714_008763 [Hevea brasiliensis]|uniref:PNPLA domain-containing protein n=1 Tax=Hevea brasiliensis TaxID=3981 RepID=A0A6A6MYJ8_HEVBR|nr:hypothetical protein GH714_008763 [Hevea brasiliensis]
MRGILSGKALAYLEHALKIKSGNPEARIADYFDVAAGTGIGGIFTAMLFGSKDHNHAIMKADDTWRFWPIMAGKFTVPLLELSYDYEEVKNWRARHWARPMARIAGDGSADSVDQAIAMAFGQCRNSNYVRIQLGYGIFCQARLVIGFKPIASLSGKWIQLRPCGPNVDTDPGPNNVKMLISIAEEMLRQKNVESVLFGGKRIGEQSNFEKLDWFADELVLEHQRRSCRIAPTVAFKQAASKPT